MERFECFHQIIRLETLKVLFEISFPFASFILVRLRTDVAR